MKKYIALGLNLFMLFNSFNVFGETRPTADKFPDKTIIIGTHAIALDVLTKELLEISLESAENSSQDKIYFKSDINKGTWYDITDSDNIAEISITTDNIITNETINNLTITHYTKETGETIEFSSGKQISLTSLNDLANPANMSELEAVKNEKEILTSIKDNDALGDAEDTYNQKVYSINKVMENITGPAINEINQKIDGMEKFITDMQSDNSISKDMISIAVDSKMNLEEKKNAICYQTVADRINYETKRINYENCKSLIDIYADVLTKLQSKISETGQDDIKTDFSEEKEKQKDEEAFPKHIEESTEEESEETTENEATTKVTTESPNSDYINDNIMNMNESEIYEDIFTKEINASAEKMILAAEKGDFEQAKNALKTAYALETAINDNGNVSDEIKDLQLDALKDIKSSEEAELKKVSEGVLNNKDFQTALKDGSTEAVLNKIKNDAAQSISDKFGDIISIDEKINEREENISDKINNLVKTKELAESVVNDVDDEFKDSVLAALKPKIDFIDEEINENKIKSVPEYKNLKDEISSLEKQVKKLNESYLGTVEEKSSNSDSLKNQLEDAVQKLFSAEDSLNQLEDSIKNGSFDTNKGGEIKANGAGTETGGNGTETDGAGAETGADGTGADGAGTETGADGVNNENNITNKQDNTNNNRGVLNQGEIGLEADENNDSQILRNQKAKYTNDEKNKINNSLKDLGEDFQPPWRLIFQNYNVKLISPVMVNRNKIYVPAKELAIQLKLQIINNKAKSNTVIIKGSRGLIEYTLGNTTIYVNDRKFNYKPAPAVFYGGQAYIPLECFERAFGFKEFEKSDYTLVY